MPVTHRYDLTKSITVKDLFHLKIMSLDQRVAFQPSSFGIAGPETLSFVC